MKLTETMVLNDPCDDTVVFRAHLQWTASTQDAIRVQSDRSANDYGCYGHVMREPDGAYVLAWSIMRGRTKRQTFFTHIDVDAVRRDCWPLVKLGPGVWDVPTSIFVKGQIHAYVTLVGVPEPASWEIRREFEGVGID